MHDLLHDPLIGVRTEDGSAKLDLPGLIAALLERRVLDHTGLRAHQADPWHVFLVQIAASVMARHPEITDPPPDADFWRSGLLELANGLESAWELVVEDVTKPAFMQHPLESAAAFEAFDPKSPKAWTPDELDVLITAKDHDLKMARIGAGDAESWLFAVVTYQTTSGVLGAGNYGVVRMNGGLGSRSIVSLINSPSPADRFIEELHVVRTIRPTVVSGGLGYADRGVVLTWLVPWSRAQAQFRLPALEPWFVESARPLRLVWRGTDVVALGATSKARQIGPKEIDSGDIADPWTVVNVSDKKKGRSALTVSANGWTPEIVARLLFQRGFESTALQRPRRGMQGTAWFVGSVLVRGQGKTDGFHRFTVPVPANVRPRLLNSDDRDRLGHLAETLLSDAREVERSLRGALMMLARGGPSSIDTKDDTTQRWVHAATSGFLFTWNDTFFPTLWRTADEEEAVVVESWRASLVGHAREALRSGEASVPLPTGRRYRALVAASGFLEGSLRKKGLIPERHSNAMEVAP